MVPDARHRFTVKDYYLMLETGVLRPELRVELLDGDVMDMPTASPFHGEIISRLNFAFTENSKNRWLIWPQKAVRLNEHTELRPDLCLLKPSTDAYATKLPRTEDVHLVVEVTDAASDFDRREKLPAYGRAGIAEVWIISPNEQTIEVFWEASFSGYNANAILRANGKAAPLAFQDAVVSVGDLFTRVN